LSIPVQPISCCLKRLVSIIINAVTGLNEALPLPPPSKGQEFSLSFLTTTFLAVTLNLMTFLEVALQQVHLSEPLYQPFTPTYKAFQYQWGPFTP